jgi:hypothetical protein
MNEGRGWGDGLKAQQQREQRVSESKSKRAWILSCRQMSRVAGKLRWQGDGFCEAGTASPPRHARTPQHVHMAYPPATRSACANGTTWMPGSSSRCSRLQTLQFARRPSPFALLHLPSDTRLRARLFLCSRRATSRCLETNRHRTTLGHPLSGLSNHGSSISSWPPKQRLLPLQVYSCCHKGLPSTPASCIAVGVHDNMLHPTAWRSDSPTRTLLTAISLNTALLLLRQPVRFLRSAPALSSVFRQHHPRRLLAKEDVLDHFRPRLRLQAFQVDRGHA